MWFARYHTVSGVMHAIFEDKAYLNEWFRHPERKNFNPEIFEVPPELQAKNISQIKNHFFPPPVESEPSPEPVPESEPEPVPESESEPLIVWKGRPKW